MNRLIPDSQSITFKTNYENGEPISQTTFCLTIKDTGVSVDRRVKYSLHDIDAGCVSTLKDNHEKALVKINLTDTKIVLDYSDLEELLILVLAYNDNQSANNRLIEFINYE